MLETVKNSGGALEIDKLRFLGKGSYGVAFGVKNPDGEKIVLKVMLELVKEHQIASKIAQEAGALQLCKTCDKARAMAIIRCLHTSLWLRSL